MGEYTKIQLCFVKIDFRVGYSRRMMFFFYICEYLGLTPQQFFSCDIRDPAQSDRFREAAEKLSPKQAEHLLLIINDILQK